MGLIDWIRNKIPTPGMVRVPPGHKVVVIYPSGQTEFLRLESGLRIADFGPTAEYRELFDIVERNLRLAPGTSIIWYLHREAVLHWASDDALLAGFLRRFFQVSQLRGTAEGGDVAVVPDCGPPAKAMMALLKSLGVGVHLPGPEGQILVEVHRPDGIVVGMPGPAFQGGEETFLRDLYSERAKLGDASEDLLRRSREEERAFIKKNRQESASAIGAPLSELMELLGSTGSEEHYLRFVHEFRRSTLGVVAEGAPKGTEGAVKSSDRHPISLGSSVDEKGREVLLAFADPPAFAQRFGRPFNADTVGESMLETVLINPECHGILVNSAIKEVSAIIDRDTIERLLRQRQ
jgi:hypothetical protein